MTELGQGVGVRAHYPTKFVLATAQIYLSFQYREKRETETDVAAATEGRDMLIPRKNLTGKFLYKIPVLQN